MDQVACPFNAVTLHYAKIARIIHSVLNAIKDIFYKMENVFYVIFHFAKNARPQLNVKYVYSIIPHTEAMIQKCACRTVKCLIEDVKFALIIQFAKTVP